MRVLEEFLEREEYFALMLIPVFVLGVVSSFQHDPGYWLDYWWLLPVSVCIALFANMLGVSSAVMFVPTFAVGFTALSKAFPNAVTMLQPKQAVMLGLMVEAFGLTSSSLAYLRWGTVDRTLAWKTALAAMPFVLVGSLLSFYLPKPAFYFVISGALVISSYLLLHEERTNSKHDALENIVVGSHNENEASNVTLEDRDGNKYKYNRNGFRERVTGYGVGGLFQGIAGFGIGEIGITSMILSKIPIHVAIGTNVLIVASNAFIAASAHLLHAMGTGLEVPWNIAVMAVPGAVVGGQLAPYVAARMETERLEKSAVLLFAVIASSLIYMGVQSL